MPRYLISLDLSRPHHNSTAIADLLRSLDHHSQNVLSNVWLVSSNLPIHYIRARLLPHLALTDKLYICDVGREAIGVNVECDLDALASPSCSDEPAHAPRKSLMAGLLRSILRRRSKLLVAATATRRVTAATLKSSRSA